MRTQASLSSIGRLLAGESDDPFSLLGPHEIRSEQSTAMAVRAFLPKAERAWVLHAGHQTSSPMRRIHPAGIFEAICPCDASHEQFRYQLRIDTTDGSHMTQHDPYSFAPLLTDFDLYLLGEGRHLDLHHRLGAQPRTIDGVSGINFAVWAPNARTVSVIGDFNQWDGRQHPMRKHVPSGVWELFIPDLRPGVKYKFAVRQQHGGIVEKADPFAFASEVPPRSASIVADLDAYQWQDSDWLERRRHWDYLHQPISIYEVHMGSWKIDPNAEHGWKNYRDLAHEMVAYCNEMGFTHIELMPVTEHPFTGSWGYQSTGYFASTSRYGSPEDFMYFVDHCHQHGIGVILDWVPAHFPKDDHGLRRFDGTALFEHEDPRQGEHPDWGTLIFNYGRNEVRNFLLSSARFWLEKYHIDGLRVDAVASMLYLDYSRQPGEWIPNRHGGRENLEAIEFLKEFNEVVHRDYPGVVTFAEESTAWPGVSRPVFNGGLGFSMKWNMGWMNDSLRYMHRDPVHRKFHHDEMTFSLIYAFNENFVLPLSHDEVVHGKHSLIGQMPGDLWQQFANLRLLYSFMWTHPGKKLLFMGSELAQWHEWNHDAQIQWELLQFDNHRGLQKMIGDLNRLYTSEPALFELDFEKEGFDWIDCMNRDASVLAWERKSSSGETMIVACSFTPTVHKHHRSSPRGVSIHRVLNSDSHFYGGSNVGNGGDIEARPGVAQGRPWSLSVTLPPLGLIVLKRQS
ncbi:MAG: 1,4-alpha-glucan branching protein GlgB [Pirellulaceae bacterium]